MSRCNVAKNLYTSILITIAIIALIVSTVLFLIGLTFFVQFLLLIPLTQSVPIALLLLFLGIYLLSLDYTYWDNCND